MSWNHRVVRHRHPSGDESLEIHEVYYDDDGKPDGVTEEGVSVAGETVEELNKVLALMQQAISKPILDWEEVGTPKKVG